MLFPFHDLSYLFRFDVWGTVAKPANFTDTTFKGGSRPEDMYARIRFGIPAVGMPAHAPPAFAGYDVAGVGVRGSRLRGRCRPSAWRCSSTLAPLLLSAP